MLACERHLTRPSRQGNGAVLRGFSVAFSRGLAITPGQRNLCHHRESSRVMRFGRVPGGPARDARGQERAAGQNGYGSGDYSMHGNYFTATGSLFRALSRAPAIPENAAPFRFPGGVVPGKSMVFAGQVPERPGAAFE